MDDPTKPDLRISYLEHRSMRADAARLTELVSAAQPADVARLRALADWYARYEGAIHDHHHAEEAVVYPALLERDPSFAEADGQLVGMRSFVFAGPWVLDHASPTERAELLGGQPLLLRVLYRLALRPRYQRLVRPLGQTFHPARS
jgi:hypothetical protein